MRRSKKEKYPKPIEIAPGQVVIIHSLKNKHYNERKAVVVKKRVAKSEPVGTTIRWAVRVIHPEGEISAKPISVKPCNLKVDFVATAAYVFTESMLATEGMSPLISPYNIFNSTLPDKESDYAISDALTNFFRAQLIKEGGDDTKAKDSIKMMQHLFVSRFGFGRCGEQSAYITDKLISIGFLNYVKIVVLQLRDKKLSHAAVLLKVPKGENIIIDRFFGVICHKAAYKKCAQVKNYFNSSRALNCKFEFRKHEINYSQVFKGTEVDKYIERMSQKKIYKEFLDFCAHYIAEDSLKRALKDNPDLSKAKKNNPDLSKAALEKAMPFYKELGGKMGSFDKSMTVKQFINGPIKKWRQELTKKYPPTIKDPDTVAQCAVVNPAILRCLDKGLKKSPEFIAALRNCLVRHKFSNEKVDDLLHRYLNPDSKFSFNKL